MLSLIVPTYNEREAVPALVERVRRALGMVPYELVFVDDSTDGTDALIVALAREDPRIRLLHRTGQRGLATAVVEGIGAARGEVVCVLDADLQHPPERIPDLLRALEETGADLVVASRYVPGGSYQGLGEFRRLTSRVATWLARLLLRRARLVSDPMSGFFAFRRSVVEGVELRPVGYKILLEILARGHFRKVAEVPYVFEARAAGHSKLSLQQNLDYLRHLLRLLPANPEDLRFVRFGLVGSSGIAVNTAALWGLVRLGVHYRPAGALAIATAITWNFLWNDAFTWRDRRSRNLRTKLRRYLQYWAVTGVGSALQYALYLVLTAAGLPYLVSNLVGIAVAVGWNYRMHGSWTWKPTEPAITRVVYRPT
ncbi:MAG: glycosyltransferase family 2 protein [Armatimonadota bacterium]|nr:glycosyltransferase family 2 protein [Armatimonadota bacterium]